MEVASAYRDSLWSSLESDEPVTEQDNDLVLTEDDLLIESNDEPILTCNCEFANASGLSCTGSGQLVDENMCPDCIDVWPLSTAIWTCGCECEACVTGQLLLIGRSGDIRPNAHLHTRPPSSDAYEIERARLIEVDNS